MISFKIFTLFPELFPGPLAASITGAALNKNIWSLKAINIRDYALDERKTVDDTPYGGGAGMVLKPDIIANAIESNITLKTTKLIYLSPRGKKFTQETAVELAKQQEIALLCGRYEGVDQRAIDQLQMEEISIGDYVLSGGEMAAYVVIDAILRNVTGVLGKEESLHEESFNQAANFANLLEYPHYTRPATWRGITVPEVLTSGNHKEINNWRKQQAILTTQKNRPDLLK